METHIVHAETSIQKINTVADTNIKFVLTKKTKRLARYCTNLAVMVLHELHRNISWRMVPLRRGPVPWLSEQRRDGRALCGRSVPLTGCSLLCNICLSSTNLIKAQQTLFIRVGIFSI